MNNEFQVAVDKALEDVWARVSADVERLTKEQFIEALTQAIRSGDFMRFITVQGGGQSVTYEPFRKVRELEARISELESDGQRLRNRLNEADGREYLRHLYRL